MAPFAVGNLSHQFYGKSVSQNKCQDFIHYDGIEHEAAIFGKAFAMVSLVLFTIIGNLLVIVAVLISSRLRTVTNFFIASLAVSDFLIGIAVLPFSFTQDLLGFWVFGYAWCRIWLALDVWVSTASIYNLVIIALDRYIGVTKPLTYRSLVTSKRAAIAIGGTWLWSFLVSFPPMITFQTNAAESHDIDDSSINANDCQCTALDNTASYIVFSASSSFYLPFMALLYIYIKIYLKIRRATVAMEKGYVTVKRVQQHEDLSSSHANNNNISKDDNRLQPHNQLGQKLSILSTAPNIETVALRVHRGKYNAAGATRNNSVNECASTKSLPAQRALTLKPGPTMTSSVSTDIAQTQNSLECGKTILRRQKLRNYNSIDSGVDTGKETSCLQDTVATNAQHSDTTATGKERHGFHDKYNKKLKREVRAAKTVAFVTGCFFFCWSGFCIVYTMKALPFCQAQHSDQQIGDISQCVPPWVFALVLWLGYANSALNPLIYAVCNCQFRRTFKRILCCSYCKSCKMIKRECMNVTGAHAKDTLGRPQHLVVVSSARLCDSDQAARMHPHSSSCDATEV